MNYIHLEEIDTEHGEMDTGDYQYCSDCGEWAVPETIIEINPDTHEIYTRSICPCGAESESL